MNIERENNKKNAERRCFLILLAILLGAFIIFIPISAVTKIWGLTIGWLIGSLITLITQLLLFRSGKVITDSALDTGKGTGLVFSFYFLRFILYGAGLIICALMQFVFKINLFNWSIFTCVGAFLPSALVIAIFYRTDKDKKVEVKDNK